MVFAVRVQRWSCLLTRWRCLKYWGLQPICLPLTQLLTEADQLNHKFMTMEDGPSSSSAVVSRAGTLAVRSSFLRVEVISI